MPQDVVIRMSAQEAGAFRAWSEQQRAVNQTAREMNQLTAAAGTTQTKFGHLESGLGASAGKLTEVATNAGRAGQQFKQLGSETGGAKSALTDYFAANVGAWVAANAGISVAVGSIKELAQAYREVRREEAQTTFDLDATFRDLAGQAGITESELPAMQQQVIEVARQEALPEKVVSRGMQQLISSGFDPRLVISGGVGKEALEAVNAMAGGGEHFDVVEGMKAVAQYLKGTYGIQGLTAENARREARELQALWRGKDIQAEDLTFIARSAGQASMAGIDSTTFKATYARLRDQFNAEMSGTAMRSIISSLQTAKTNKSKMEGLAMLDMTPEDVDLKDEDWVTVWARFNRALGKVDKTRAAAAMKQIFETESMNQALTLATNYRDIPKYVETARDWSGYEQALGMKTGGFSAAKQKLETEIAGQRLGGEGARLELISKAIEAHYGGASGKFLAGMFEKFAPLAGNESALRFVVTGKMAPKILEKVDRAMQPAKPASTELSAPAPAFDEGAFDKSERQREADRKRMIEAQAAAQEKADQQQLAELRIDAANSGGKLVLQSLADEKYRGTASDAQIRAEARAVEEGIRSGRVRKLRSQDVRQWHKAVSEDLDSGAYGPRDAASGREQGIREERMLQLLEGILKAVEDNHEVSVQNLDDLAKSEEHAATAKKRRVRRSQALSPPTAGLGR